jgi:endonuclease III related protein
MHDSSAVRASNSASARLLEIFDRLLAAYGRQGWWPGSGGFETIAGAILTQSAAWSNVERALDRLRAAKALAPDAMLALDESDLAELIRPSGYYNSKARKLIAFCRMVEEDFGGELNSLLSQEPEELRDRLLATYGIGPETADDIVLYAAGAPTFVVDAYTRRLFGRLGIKPERDEYEAWRSMFMSHLPRDAQLYNEYHALIVRHAKISCMKQPACGACVLSDACVAANGAGSGAA